MRNPAIVLALIASALSVKAAGDPVSRLTSLERSVREATFVARGFVEKVENVHVDADLSSQLCGRTYLIEVSSVYKGSLRRSVQIASYGDPEIDSVAARVGHEVLVLLQDRAADEDPLARIMPPPEKTPARLACLRKLGDMKPLRIVDSVFAIEGCGSNMWVVLPSSTTVELKDNGALPGGECRSLLGRGSLIDWSAMEPAMKQWIYKGAQ